MMEVLRASQHVCLSENVLERDPKRSKQLSTVAIWLSVWTLSCRCLVKLSKGIVSALHHCLLVFLFLADQIFYRSYVDRQHFRLRSFASLCSTVLCQSVREPAVSASQPYQAGQLVLSLTSQSISQSNGQLFFISVNT